MINIGKSNFLDLGKCGTSFLEDILRKCCVVNNPGHRHKGFDHLPSEEYLRENLIYTVIRNPLEYYVSHLTYSRKSNGPIFKGLVSQGYNDKHFPHTVEGYVEAMMIKRMDLPVTNHSNPERIAWRNMPDDLGMMTMQYILLLDRNFLVSKKRTVQEVEDWYAQYWFNNNRKTMTYLTNENMNLGPQAIELIRNYADYFILKNNYETVLNNLENFNKKDDIHKIQNISHKSWHNEKSIDIITHYDRILFDNIEFSKE